MRNLSEKAKKLYNENMRKWRKNNPEKVRQYNINYWEKKAKNYSLEMEIKDLKATGLSQREIAVKLNVSVGTVNHYLNKP